MGVLTDPIAQQLLIGSLIAGVLLGLGMALFTGDSRPTGKDTR